MLIPIQYHNKKYPSHIKSEIDEIAGHFDVQKISPDRSFSLHTEYSFGARNFDSELISRFNIIKSANRNGVPQLWYSQKWALEFAEFIQVLCGSNYPSIIEIHPPFSDYVSSIDDFLRLYGSFEEKILAYYPKTKIFIENRMGSMYKGGRFLVSKPYSLLKLCEKIEQTDLKLRMAFDIPQLFTTFGGPKKLQPNILKLILDQQTIIQPFVECIHLWGKKKSQKGRLISHSGDLDTYFGNQELKLIFLEWFQNFLDDGRHRYFVPEVNSSSEDLHSIVYDLESSGIKFAN